MFYGYADGGNDTAAMLLELLVISLRRYGDSHMLFVPMGPVGHYRHANVSLVQ
jgi:hypothetical protein